MKLGNTTFDEAAQLLRDDSGKSIALRAQSIRVLDILYKAQGTLLTKDELAKAVWGKTIVGDDSLVQCIKEIRQALGDSAHTILQTVYRRGYCLVVPEAAKFGNVGETAEVAETDQATGVAQATNCTPASAVYAKPSLAILAFTSYEGDERSEHLALSFAGDLSSELARHTEFRLVSRHSAFALRGQNLSTREICERLDVNYFVGGQVQFSEDGLRWSIELVNGFDDQVVWSEHNAVQYADRNLAKGELTWRIACSIHDILRRSARTRALSRPPDSLDAYETTQIVVATMAKTSISASRESQRLAAAAVKKFPFYPRAWTALANTHLWDTSHAHTGQWHEGRAAQILEEIHKSIALDPSQAYAFAILAGALTLNGQYEEALVTSERAIGLAPSDADMLQYRSVTLFWCGKLVESLALSQTMMTRMPLRSAPHLASHGRLLYFSGQRHEGAKLLMEVVSLTPGGNQARMSLIVAQHEAGERAHAAENFLHLRRNTTNLSRAYFGKRWAMIPEIRERYLVALGAYGFE